MPVTRLSRRAFVGSLAAGLGGLFTRPVAAHLRKTQKRAILVWMAGGPSQLETWDPKPDTASAGPHKAIPTAVPGVHFDEYMPRLARLADRMAVVRTVTGRIGDHAQAAQQGFTGFGPGAAPAPPHWLSACAHELAADPDLWPGVVALGRSDPAPGGGFLGPRFDPLPCPGDGKPPDGLPKTAADDAAVYRRDALRDALATDFRYGHDEARLATHDAAFGNVGRLIARRDLFDLSREPLKRVAAYGDTALGRDCLLACRLVERGVPFVQVTPPGSVPLPWDLHNRMAERQKLVTTAFDTAVGAMIDDLIARGLWDHTLVVLTGEFGRTPGALANGGRDHWPKNWAMSFGGCGVKGGAVVGTTSKDGREIADRPVSVPDLLATFYTALGVDPRKEFETPVGPVQLLERGRGNPLTDVL